MIMIMGQWLVTKIYSSWAGVAQRELDRLQVEHFLPRIREQKITRHRIVDHDVPMFPGYMFVLAASSWQFLHRVRGICFVLRHAETNEPVRSPKLDTFIENLRKSLSGDVLIEPKALFKRGSRVRSMQGLLEGYCGIYLKDLSNHRGVVEMDGLGKVEFDIADLELVA
jgi:hypothetical protein